MGARGTSLAYLQVWEEPLLCCAGSVLSCPTVTADSPKDVKAAHGTEGRGMVEP